MGNSGARENAGSVPIGSAGASGGRRWWWVFVVASLVLAAGTFWAGLVVGRQQAVPQEITDEPMFATVTEQSVGRTYTLGVVVLQERVPVSVNLLPGVLTAVATDGEFGVGDQIYAVDGTPVRAVGGNEPFFRDLDEDARGADVHQLNDALVAMGYLNESGDVYTWVTAEAVRQWQRDTRRPVTGVIGRGELLAVGDLPASLVIDEDAAAVGSIVGEGDAIVLAPSSSPEFLVPVTPAQSQAIPLEAPVQVRFSDTEWQATVTGAEDDINGNTNLVLSGPDATPVCGSECGLLPPDESVTLMGTIEVVPQTTGPAVPIAALQIQPSGEVQVMVRAPSSSPQSGDGELAARTVTVVASQDGIAVVEGLEVGEEVQLFATGTSAGVGKGGSSNGLAPEENNNEGSEFGESEEQQSNPEGAGTSEGEQ